MAKLGLFNKSYKHFLEEFLKKSQEKQSVEFPLGIFPAKLQSMLSEADVVGGLNKDFVGCAILATISAALGNSRKIELKKSHRDIASIFLCVVAPSTVNKTRAIKFALKPLMEIEHERQLAYKQAIKEYRKRDREYSPNSSTGSQNQEPTLERLVLNDTTVEQLQKVLTDNTNGVAYYVDEFSKQMNYLTANPFAEAAFLELWNGGAQSKDRVGYSLYMPDVFVTMVGTTQPCFIKWFGEKDRNSTGQTARFLFCYQEGLAAREWSQQDYEGDEYEFYHQLVRKIVENRDLQDTPHWYKFNEESKELVFMWQKHNTRLINHSTTDSIKAVYGKLDSYLLRLSLVLQSLTDFCDKNEKNTIVGENTVMNAISLVEYFRAMALKVQNALYDDVPLAIKELKKDAHIQFYQQLPNDIIKREDAYKIGTQFGLSIRQIGYILGNGKLFKSVNHGYYAKIY